MASAESDPGRLKDTIIVSKAGSEELLWMKATEVQYEGKMFDVKRKIIKDDSILLVGHYDSWDDELLSVISLLFDEESPFEDDEDQQPGYQTPFDAILNNSYCYRLPEGRIDVIYETDYHQPFYGLLLPDIEFRPPEAYSA